jgi:general secretion pathway protein E
MTIQAALTGHLVLSTLHTNDAPSAVTRLLDLGVPFYLINSTVIGVMAQRLVRTLCANCKTPAPIETHDWDKLVGDYKIPKPAHVYHPVGCLECRNTGFRGRSGIYEMLSMSPALRKLVTADTNLAQLTKQARAEGMQPLIINGAEKVAAGLTTIEELLKVAPPLDSE